MNYLATPTERTFALALKQGVLRPRDLETHGIPRHQIAILHRAGKLIRVGRGLYMHPDAGPTENHTFALVAKRTPDALICLLSALRFHELTTQLPSATWIALHPKARRPHIPEVQLEVVRFSGMGLTEGIDTLDLEGVRVRITNPARTVADCFRYRNKIGRDVAVEALRDAVSQGKASVLEIAKYAEVRRVARVMRPYLEMYL